MAICSSQNMVCLGKRVTLFCAKYFFGSFRPPMTETPHLVHDTPLFCVAFLNRCWLSSSPFALTGSCTKPVEFAPWTAFPGLFGFRSGSFPQTSNPKRTPCVFRAPSTNEKAEKAGSNAGTTAALLFIAEVCPWYGNERSNSKDDFVRVSIASTFSDCQLTSRDNCQITKMGSVTFR